MVSTASAWEIAARHHLGKLRGAEVVAQDIAGAIASRGKINSIENLSRTCIREVRCTLPAGQHRPETSP